MKKILLSVFILVTAISLQAQTNQGDWMVGGYFRVNTSDNNTQIGLTPTAGAFVIDNLAIGGNLIFDYSKTGEDKETIFGIGPFARYYFTQANVKPMFHGSVNFLSRKVKGPGYSNTTSGLNYFLGGGAAIFISEHVSIDILAGYDHTRFDGDGSGGFALNVGFQVYLHKGQVERKR